MLMAGIPSLATPAARHKKIENRARGENYKAVLYNALFSRETAARNESSKSSREQFAGRRRINKKKIERVKYSQLET